MSVADRPVIRPDPEPGTGLSSAEAAARLAADGPNVLPVPQAEPAWRRLAKEMVHFFALLFWLAGALAFVAGLPQLGVAVFVVIVLNGTFAFVQEQRAAKAAERLRDLLPRRVTVVRDGVPTTVPAEELVVGDLVRLEQGDRVSADLQLVDAHGLKIDTSTLTGESVSAAPSRGDRVDAGTFVVEGEASAQVIATGGATRLATIASLTRAQHPEPSPLRLELERVSRFIALAAVSVGVTFFLVSLLLGTDPTDGFLFAIGVTVALVPEGLLPTVTLSLAIGAQRMAAHNALVRRLEAAETLGSTTFICTDKTGTLTRNEMEVVEVWMPAGRAVIVGRGYEPSGRVFCEPPEADAALRELARAARQCSTGCVRRASDGRWVPQGDPMEAALDVLARRLRIDDAPALDVIQRFPFDPRRRRMSIVTERDVLVKGAPDAVLPRCTVPAGAETALAAMTDRGLRVLAVARRPVAQGQMPRTVEDAERDLVLLGLVGFEDPPREGAREAIARCRRAGIRVAMVTGDHPSTALAIGREVGLVDDAGSEPRVLVGADLPDDDDALGALIDHDGVVIARVAPEHKLRIARVLYRRGHVVAMTGDGVNDAPALREAAIGVAMGRSGTDVAREAADLVLLDDDFATIVAAVEQGRSTYANIRRFLTYHLSDNVAELAPFIVWALSGGAFPLALGVLQVLALDIGTDVMPALALGAEPPSHHVLDRPPPRRHLLDRAVFARAFGLLGPVEAVIALAAFVVTFVAAGWALGNPFPEGDVLLTASGAAFTAVVLGQLANVIACRSTIRPFWRVPPTSNPLVPWAIVTEVALLLVFLFVPFVADLLDQAPPSWAGFAVALVAVPGVLLADTLQKVALARRRAKSSPVLGALPVTFDPGQGRAQDRDSR